MSKTEQEVLGILQFLVECPVPPRGIKQISEQAGVSHTETHRYVNREAFERFTPQQVENLRRYRPSMYVQIIGTARIDSAGQIWLNRSKHSMLAHYAHRNGYRIHYTRSVPHGFVVERVRIDGLYADQVNASDPDAVAVSHTES